MGQGGRPGIRCALAGLLLLAALLPAQAAAGPRGPQIALTVSAGAARHLTIVGHVGSRSSGSPARRRWRVELQRRAGEHWTWTTAATTRLKAPYRTFAIVWTAPAGKGSVVLRVRVRSGSRVLATSAAKTVRLKGAPTGPSSTGPDVSGGDTIFSDGFESGDFSAWTQVATGADGKAAVQSRRVATGKLAAQLSETSKAGSKAFIRKVLDAEHHDLVASGDFRVVSEGRRGGGAMLLSLLDPRSTRLVSVHRLNGSGGPIQVSYGGSRYRTIGSLPLKTTANLSLHVIHNPAGSTVALELNGTPVYETSSAKLGPAGIATLQIGNDAAPQAFTIVADTIRVKAPSAPAGTTTGPGAGPGQGPSPLPPINTGAPSISGNPQTGQTLSANAGAWSGAQPMTFGYAWQRCKAGSCTPIGGATAATYTAVSADLGATLRVAVTATNAVGAATADSGQTGVVVAPATPPANTTAPTISGTARDGNVLTATPGVWTGAQPIAYAYGWTRCNKTGTACGAIAGATNPTYVVTTADVGSTLRVGVTATNAGGTATATSKATGTVAAAPTPGGLVALWHMNETSGSSMADSAKGHTGSLHGVTLGQPGFAGTAFGFSGSAYALVPHADDLNPYNANLTLTIRLKTTSAPATPDWDLLRKGLYVTVGGEYKMEYQPTGQASCGFLGSGGYSELTAGPAINNGAWHTVQCVKTGSSIAVVVDGQTFSQSVSIGSIANTDSVPIGARPDSEFFQGALDEASIQIG